MADAQKKLKEDRMLARTIVHTLCGVILLGVLATSTTGAMKDCAPHDVTSPSAARWRCPGVSLAAGTYIFEVANPDGGSDVVRCLAAIERKCILMRIHARRGSRVDEASSTPIHIPSAKLLLVPLPR